MGKAFIVILACLGCYLVLPRYFHFLDNAVMGGVTWAAILTFIIFCIAINLKSD
jgi:hypothetical protein